KKQLKALASPSKAKDISSESSPVPALPEKTTPSVNLRASLFDRMQAENIVEESQDCLANSPTMKDVLWPGAEKGGSHQELSSPRNCKTGLFYGWQTPSESASIGGHKHERKMSGGNTQSDTTMASPVSPPQNSLV
ncbi:hypothetical protein KI387_042332, partial [Taxus chinensis]